MKGRATVGIVSGAILVLSGLAHAFAGWPSYREGLHAAGTPEELVSGLRVAWHFGSLAMLSFGVMTLLLAFKVLKGQEISSEPIQVIGIAYLLFGLSALVTQGQNLHYLLFIATALLVSWFGFWRTVENE